MAKVYYIVSDGQILNIGTDGRLYYEQELVKLAARFPPSPFRDITQSNSAFFDSCTHLNPESFQAYCRDLAILLIRFCTPLDKADEYKVPFLYDIRRALHLPLQGSQLLMFVWSKLTSYAPQNMAQIITALKSLISRTLETYRPSTDPIYLLLFLTSVLDQTVHLRPPHVIDGKMVFDQLLVTLSRYFTSADALDSSQGWHSMVAKILDARSNNKAYNADILDYAKFQDVHGMKRQLMAAAAKMGHQFTKTGECPPFLACRDLLKEVKDAMFNQNQPRGRTQHRREQERNSSRSSSRSTQGRRSRSPGRPWNPVKTQQPGTHALSAEVDIELTPEELSSLQALINATEQLLDESLDTGNTAVESVFATAYQFYKDGLAATADTSDPVDAATALSIIIDSTPLDEHGREFSGSFMNFLGMIAYNRAKGRKTNARRAPPAIRRAFKQRLTQAPNPNTTSFGTGQPARTTKSRRDAVKHPDFKRKKKKTPKTSKGVPHAEQTNKSDKRTNLVSLVKFFLRYLEKPCPSNFDELTWHKNKSVKAIKIVQDILFRITKNIPSAKQQDAVRTVNAHWTFSATAHLESNDEELYVADGDTDGTSDADDDEPFSL